jgi:hypothetical protein
LDLSNSSIGGIIDDASVTWQIASRVPFSVLSAPTSINRLTVPAGIYMDAAYILNGTVQNSQIGNGVIDSAKIADAAITTAKISDAAITSAKIGTAQINTAHIGTLNASAINAGFINADRIQVGTATVLADSKSDWEEYSAPYGVDTKTGDGVSFNFASTGSKVTVTASINASIFSYNTSTNSVRFELKVWADDWYPLDSQFVYVPAVFLTGSTIKLAATSGTLQWRGAFNPNDFTIGNVNIRIEVSATPLDINNNVTGFALSTGYPGALRVASSLIATENKI